MKNVYESKWWPHDWLNMREEEREGKVKDSGVKNDLASDLGNYTDGGSDDKAKKYRTR